MITDKTKKVIVGIIIFILITIGLTFILNSLFFKHEEGLVFITDTGSCYHSAECSHLRSAIPIGEETAIKKGYYACSHCGGQPNGMLTVNNYFGAFGIAICFEILGFFAYYAYKIHKQENQAISTNNKVTVREIHKSDEFAYKPSSIDKTTMIKDEYSNNSSCDNKIKNETLSIAPVKHDDPRLSKIKQLHGDLTYFILSDLYDKFDEIIDVLNSKGFDINNNNHVVIITGSLLTIDRPYVAFVKFYNKLKEFNRIILIKNDVDEDIINAIDSLKSFMEDEDNSFYTYEDINSVYYIDYLGLIIGKTGEEFFDTVDESIEKINNVKLINIIRNDTYFYYELDKYIITHGWIPIKEIKDEYVFKKTWRKSNYDDWKNVLRLDYNSCPQADKIIINTASYTDRRGLVCDGEAPSKYIFSTGINICLHNTSTANCLVIKQDKNDSTVISYGYKNIGFFFMHNKDVLYSIEKVDCDNEQDLFKPSGNINSIWNKVSKEQLNGKYQNNNFDDLLYGEVWYDKTLMTHTMQLYKPKNGLLKLRWVLPSTQYIYRDSIDNIEYKDYIDNIEDGIVAQLFDAYGIKLNMDCLDDN